MRRSEHLALIVSLFIWIAYLLVLISGYSTYVNLVRDNPLAMIDSLFPSFNLVVVSMSLLCFSCVIFNIRNKYVHILLLTQFSLLLWVTPFYLSGFVLNHDTLYHGGVSLYAPDVLKGIQTHFSGYLENYPSSFIFNWIFLNVVSVDLPNYGRLIFPTLTAIITALLIYTFVSKLFNSKTAFASTFLTIMGLYYVEIHLAPQSISVIMVLAIVTLLHRKGNVKRNALSLFLFLVLITSHPIHPILLTLLIVAPAVSKRLTHKESEYGQVTNWYIVLIVVGWFAWTFFKAIEMGGQSFVNAIHNLITLNFAIGLTEAATPTKTLFPLFGFLRMYVLYTYALISLIFFLSYLDFNKIRRGRKMYAQMVEALGTKRLMIIIFIGSCLLLAYLLRLSTEEAGVALVQRAIFFMFLGISIFIASSLNKIIENTRFNSRKLLAVALVYCWVATIAFIYPLASYYPTSHSAIPYSEGVGIEFLGRIDLDSKSVSMFRPSDLAIITKQENFRVVWLPAEKSNLLQYLERIPEIDVAVFPRRTYYYSSMVSFSFDDNAYTRMYEYISQSQVQNKIYSNPSYEIFFQTSIENR